MILVVAEATVKEGRAEQFLKAAEACIAGTRKEPGNISYELMADAFNPCRFAFVERWQSRESLNQHMKTEHFKTFSAAIHDLLAGDLAVGIYNAEKID